MGESGGINMEAILANLEEPCSISTLHRRLGKKTHRFVLTGYLFALRDLGYLEEKSYPPSKVFVVRKERLGELAPQIAGLVARAVERREIKGAAEEREDLEEEEEKDEQKE